MSRHHAVGLHKGHLVTADGHGQAGDRGEQRLRYPDVLDAILAPIVRFLFRVGGVDSDYLDLLVDRLLTTTSSLSH
jgi:hypothetical protein